jgi:hypothetical protein
MTLLQRLRSDEDIYPWFRPFLYTHLTENNTFANLFGYGRSLSAYRRIGIFQSQNGNLLTHFCHWSDTTAILIYIKDMMKD